MTYDSEQRDEFLEKRHLPNVILRDPESPNGPVNAKETELIVDNLPTKM